MSGDRRKSSSWFSILLQASAGPVGLLLGYIVLCQFGPQYDFLGIWHRADPSKSSAVKDSNASNSRGWPLQKTTPKAAANKSQGTATDPAATPSPNLALHSVVVQPTAKPEPVVVATRSPADDITRSTNSAISTPETPLAGPSEAPPNESVKGEPNKLQFTTAVELQQAIAKVRTAKEVVQLLSSTIADQSTPEETHSSANVQLATWEERAASEYVRLGDNWMPRTDAVAKRETANELVLQAANLLTIENDRPALERLRQAKNVDPEATSAAFLLGVHSALGQRNYQAAKEHFAECLRRRPDDVGALNDVGLSCLLLGKNTEALKHFRTAVAINPRSAEVAHNLRRIVKQDGLKNLLLPPPVKTGYVDLLNTAVNNEAVAALEGLGWLYIQPASASATGGMPAEIPNVLEHLVQVKTDKTVRIHLKSIEDRECFCCRGTGKAPCSNPECKNGQVIVKTGQELVGKDAVTKKNIYRDTYGPKNCPTCRGNGYLNCEKCFGLGTDPSLNERAAQVSKR